MDLSGILSQAGFAFQMKVFLKQVTELNPNAVASYEYLDDISASTSLDELSGRIGLCESRLIQVKNTNVGKRDVVQIYTNWILAVSKHESISSFWLLYSDDKSLSVHFDAITAIQFIESLDERAKKSSRSNAAKLRASLNDDDIVRLFSCVKEKASAYAINENAINAEIRDNLSSIFHLTSNVDLFDERVAELRRRIHFNVSEAMLKAIPYKIDYESFMQLCEQICAKISSKRFEPDYSAWMAAADGDLLDARESSREYRQLHSCQEDASFITQHLYFCEYYRSINYERLAKCQADTVASLESAAFNNFCDSCNLLKLDGKDDPMRRLIETKRCQNSYAYNDHEKWGSCIWLTREETPTEKRISWKDETND